MGDTTNDPDDATGGNDSWLGAWDGGTGSITLAEVRASGEIVLLRPLTFEHSRQAAYRLLGDAAAEIRAGDWEPPLTGPQSDQVFLALELIAQAKSALNRAAA